MAEFGRKKRITDHDFPPPNKFVGSENKREKKRNTDHDFPPPNKFVGWENKKFFSFCQNVSKTKVSQTSFRTKKLAFLRLAFSEI